jgi:hypothetical protein
MRCRSHRHATDQFECARCCQYFCWECVAGISGRHYCSVCQHQLAATPATAALRREQDAEQDIDKAVQLGFDIGLLRRETKLLKALHWRRRGWQP